MSSHCIDGKLAVGVPRLDVLKLVVILFRYGGTASRYKLPYWTCIKDFLEESTHSKEPNRNPFQGKFCDEDTPTGVSESFTITLCTGIFDDTTLVIIECVRTVGRVEYPCEGSILVQSAALASIKRDMSQMSFERTARVQD